MGLAEENRLIGNPARLKSHTVCCESYKLRNIQRLEEFLKIAAVEAE